MLSSPFYRLENGGLERYPRNTAKKWQNWELSPSLTLSGFPGRSAVNNPPAMQETQVQYLGQGNFLEKEMATHSSILAWKVPWAEEPGELHEVVWVRHDLAAKLPQPPDSRQSLYASHVLPCCHCFWKMLWKWPLSPFSSSRRKPASWTLEKLPLPLACG